MCERLTSVTSALSRALHVLPRVLRLGRVAGRVVLLWIRGGNEVRLFGSLGTLCCPKLHAMLHCVFLDPVFDDPHNSECAKCARTRKKPANSHVHCAHPTRERLPVVRVLFISMYSSFTSLVRRYQSTSAGGRRGCATNQRWRREAYPWCYGVRTSEVSFEGAFQGEKCHSSGTRRRRGQSEADCG